MYGQQGKWIWIDGTSHFKGIIVSLRLKIKYSGYYGHSLESMREKLGGIYDVLAHKSTSDVMQKVEDFLWEHEKSWEI